MVDIALELLLMEEHLCSGSAENPCLFIAFIFIEKKQQRVGTYGCLN